jgi:hypothetical protein
MREFANQKALQDYVESNDLAYLWEDGRTFVSRYEQLSPRQCEVVAVHTKRGLTKALLFSKAILRAEFAADAPLREAMAIKHQRSQAMRAQRAVNKANDASRREHRALAIKRKRLRTKRAAKETTDARGR